MKSKNLSRRTTLVLGLLLIIMAFEFQFVYADPLGALTQAKDNVINQIKPIVNTVIVPIIDVVLVAFLVLKISKAVALYKQGQEVHLLGIALLIAGVTLVTTFPIWGWALIA